MDFSIVVSAKLLLLLLGPLPQWLGNIPVRVFAADHESNLARWVGRDGGVSVFGDGESLSAILLEPLDEIDMEPLVFGYKDDKKVSKFSSCSKKITLRGRTGWRRDGECYQGVSKLRKSCRSEKQTGQ